MKSAPKLGVTLCMVILVPIMFSFLALGDEERNVNFLYRFHSKTIIVDATGSGDYISLIDAVKNADSGDVIRVYDGFYEGEIKIGSSISIIGNGSQTIIGGKYGYFEIRSDNVTISNLTITDHIDEKVRVCWGEHVKLDTLIIQSGKLGISLHENCNVLISNCTFSNISNNHISYYKSKEVNLLNNTFIDGPKVSMNISGRKIVLKGNKFINNSLGFDFNSIEDFDSIHIDETNRRNNNPLVFLKREENRIINCENNTQYFFINCNNITFRSGKIKNVHNPLLIYNSSFLSLSQLDIENSSDIFCSKSNNIYFDNMKFYKSGMLINKTYGMWVNNSIVNINGFMIEDSGYISIRKSHFLNITISNYFNYVSLSALYTLSSNNISIQDNIFRDNIQSIRKGDNAQSNGIIINNNTFENCNVSVSLDRVKETIISNNMIISSEYGLEYYDCEESSIFNNIFNQQGNKFYSVTISMSDKIKIYNNTIRTSMIGLKITGSNQCDVYNNTLSNNVHGLNIFHSKEGNIYNNKINNNNYGAELVNSNDIKIWKNIFIDNLNQASDNTNANKWYNSYPIGGNYWSDYHGEDKKKGVHQSESGSDGFGDLPKSLISTSDRYPIFIDTIKPKANAKGDKFVDEGSVIHFQSASTDDQMVMETIWKFVYDGVNIIISYPEFDFIFHIPGTYKILLTVFDFAGNNDTDDIIITVKDINVPISKSQGNIIKNQGSILYFNGSLSYDTGGIAKYEWIFNYNGTPYTLEGVNVSFFFDRPGRIPVTLRVTDNAGHVGESIFNVTIVDLTDPIADAGLDLTIENGQEAVFDGSLCTDNGMIKYYNWTFEYNETQLLLQGKSVIHKFVVPGIYQVTLRIEDEFGNNAEDTLIVTVIDTILPVPRISGNTQILEGESMILNGLQSTDNGRIAKYLWTFEDGAPVEYEGPTINHRFSLKGFHEVTLTVFDEWNNSASTNVTIDVLDIASPLADAGPDMIVGVGRQVTLDGSGSTDDGRMVRYEWIFEYQGKEKKLEGMVSIFTFDVPGTYIVTMKVFDQSNNIGSDEVEIKVVNYGYVRGIVLDTKGTPVKGAIVEIVASDGNRYTAETLANGSFYIEIPHGSFTWRILYDGYKELEGSGTVGLLSDSNLEIPAMEKKEDAGIGPIMFIVPVVIVLVLVIGLILFFVLRKKKPESEPQAVSEEKDEFAVKEINEDSPPIVPPMDPSLSEFTQSPPIMEEDNEEEQAPAEAVGDPFEGIGSEEIEKLINSNA